MKKIDEEQKYLKFWMRAKRQQDKDKKPTKNMNHVSGRERKFLFQYMVGSVRSCADEDVFT